MEINKIIQILLGCKEDEKTEGFLRFLSEKLWNLYEEYLMDRVLMADNSKQWNLTAPNAKENQEYDHSVTMPEGVILESVEGIIMEQCGLSVSIAEDKKSFKLYGVPSLEYFRKDGATAESCFELTIKYKFDNIEMSESKPLLERNMSFIIIQDPRKLWKDLPVNWDSMPEPRYKKDDSQAEYVKVECLADGTPQKDIVAASKRGRSHSQEAKPRDDHFKLYHMDNGWYIMAVADGAGSAKFSREGSRLACEEVVNYCSSQLSSSKPFEDAIFQYNLHKDESENEARKTVGDYIYKIVGSAAFKAHKAINAEAALKQINVKQYATTLLLAICKKFEFGWFIANFWVGDGAICLYDRKKHTSKILGVPDEGEYAGQTRFLTMSEIFTDSTSLYKRLRFNIVDDFTALFLMSDGVSDPKFETDANLNNTDKWDALWDDLKQNGVDLTDDNEETKDQLLSWLDFWSPGNHDDRTIAILYEGESDANTSKDIESSNLEPNLDTTKDTNIESSQETSVEEKLDDEAPITNNEITQESLSNNIDNQTTPDDKIVI